MTIDLSDNTPVQKTYASIPKPLYPEVKQHIEDLLNKGFITHSNSNYSSPVVCSEKRRHSTPLRGLQPVKSTDYPRPTPIAKG